MREVLQSYRDIGLFFVRFSREKHAIDKGWNKPEVFEKITVSEAEAHVKSGGFIAVLVPVGVIVADFDKPENLAWWEENKERFPGVAVQKTVNGIHVWWLAPFGVEIPAADKVTGSCGLVWTPRVAGKNACIVDPSPGRSWVTPLPSDLRKLTFLASELVPTKQVKAPAGPVGGFAKLCKKAAKHKSPGDGNPLDMALVAVGVEAGEADLAILDGLRLVWGNGFDLTRVLNLIKRTRDRFDAGEPLQGWETLVSLVPELAPYRPKEKAASEAQQGKALASAFCEKYTGLVRVDRAPMHQRDPVDWYLLDPVSRWESELVSGRLHDMFQELNHGEKLSPAAFAAACWYVATDPRMHADDRRPLPRSVSTDSGVFSYDLGRFLREDEPGTSAIRVNLPLYLDAPPITETVIWKDDLVQWGQTPEHIESEIGRIGYPGPSGLITKNYGTGGAGMTTFWGLLGAIFGPENLVDISLDDLAPERLQRTKASLEGRLAWCADDCDYKGTLGRAHILKELATAETLTGARLYRNPKSFLHTAHGRTNGNRPFRNDTFDQGRTDRDLEAWWAARIRKTQAERVDICRKWEGMREDLAILFSRGVFRALERLRTGRWADEPNQRQKALFAEVLRWVECRYLWERMTSAPGQFLTWDLIEDGYRDWWPQSDRHDRPGFKQARFHRAAVMSFGASIKEDRLQAGGLRQKGLWGLAFLDREEGEECDFSDLARCGQSAEWPENLPWGEVLFSSENENLEKREEHRKIAPSDGRFSSHSNNSPLDQLQMNVPVVGKDIDF